MRRNKFPRNDFWVDFAPLLFVQGPNLVGRHNLFWKQRGVTRYYGPQSSNLIHQGKNKNFGKLLGKSKLRGNFWGTFFLRNLGKKLNAEANY